MSFLSFPQIVEIFQYFLHGNELSTIILLGNNLRNGPRGQVLIIQRWIYRATHKPRGPQGRINLELRLRKCLRPSAYEEDGAYEDQNKGIDS
jgi:hypothetical protein